MTVLARYALFALASVSVAACAQGSHGGRRPTIELLARSITYDASLATESNGTTAVPVTLSLVGERLLDYANEDDVGPGVTKPGALPAIAAFDPPERHTCCWTPASLSLTSTAASAGATQIAMPAAIDAEPPPGADAAASSPAMQAAGVSLPSVDHVSLPASELVLLARLGVTVGSPAVAIVDVGDRSAPVVVGLRPADQREIASDPSNPPTTADLPEDAGPATGRCPRKTTLVPARYARTMTALGPAFFHQKIATPHVVPVGDVSMAWSVIGADHVRALFSSVAKGCTQRVVVDILPASRLPIPPALRLESAARGELYGAASGLRTVFVYDKIAYDVKGATPFATSAFTRGLMVRGSGGGAVTE